MTIPKKVEHVELLIINQQGISHCSFEASVISTMLSSPLLILGDPENSAHVWKIFGILDWRCELIKPALNGDI